MKSVLAFLGLLLLVCALVSSSSVRYNLSSWLGSCWNGTPVGYEAPCQDGVCPTAYPQQAAYSNVYRQSYVNRNVVVNRVYAPPPVFYRRPVVLPVRPWYRAW